MMTMRPILLRKSTAVWLIVAVAVFVNSIGLAWNLYDAIWWFDEAIHAYSTFALMLPLVIWLYGAVLTGAYRHRFLLILVLVTLGLGLGAVWEVAEWGYEQVTPKDLILGKFDTIVDLIMDAGGAFVAGWLVTDMIRKRNPHPVKSGFERNEGGVI